MPSGPEPDGVGFAWMRLGTGFYVRRCRMLDAARRFVRERRLLSRRALSPGLPHGHGLHAERRLRLTRYGVYGIAEPDSALLRVAPAIERGDSLRGRARLATRSRLRQKRIEGQPRSGPCSRPRKRFRAFR